MGQTNSRVRMVIAGLGAALALGGCDGCDDGGDNGGCDAWDPPAPDAAPPQLSIEPVSVDFGTVEIGTPSVAESFTVSNTGARPSGALTVEIVGDDATDFEIVDDACFGESLAGGEDCSIGVAFTPADLGSRAAVLQVSASEGGTATATLHGNGIGGEGITIVPVPCDFGGVVVGSTSSAVEFTVSNLGAQATGTLTAELTGADTAHFEITADGCSGSPLPSAGSCIIATAFSPQSVGAKSASLRVTAAPGGIATSALLGEGLTDASLEIDPATHDFGSILGGQQSNPATFTVTNTGDVVSGDLTLELTGTDAAAFAVVDDSCDGETLDADASCSVIVRFTPGLMDAGAMTAAVEISGLPGGTATATLDGVALEMCDPSIAPTPVDFGEVVVSETSSSVAFTVTNNCTVVSYGPIATTIGGANAGEFSFVAGANHCEGVTLGGTESCTMDVVFSPNALGVRSATLSATAIPGGTVAAVMEGTGVPP